MTEGASTMSGMRMNRSLNRVELIGHLGGDPQMLYPALGLPVCLFWLVTMESWKDQHGDAYDVAEWHRIIVWGRRAERCDQFLTRGTPIYMEGRLVSRSWRAS